MIGFTAVLPPSEPLSRGRASPSEPTIEFPITARSFSLGAAPTRDEIIAVIAEIRGAAPTTEQYDFERDDRLEITRMSRVDLLAPLVGRVVTRWAQCQKTGVEFSVTLRFPEGFAREVVRGMRLDLGDAKDRDKIGRGLWMYLYESLVHAMTVRQLVREEIDK